MDRARAVRLSMKCMDFLEKHALAMRSSHPVDPRELNHRQNTLRANRTGQLRSASPSPAPTHDTGRTTPGVRRAGRESAAVITIEGNAINFKPVRDMVKHADMKNRRGKESWWEGFKTLAEMLGGRLDLVSNGS
jgi:6-phosphofructokinase 1